MLTGLVLYVMYARNVLRLAVLLTFKMPILLVIPYIEGFP